MKRALNKVATLALFALIYHEWLFTRYEWWEFILALPAFALIAWMAADVLRRA